VRVSNGCHAVRPATPPFNALGGGVVRSADVAGLVGRLSATFPDPRKPMAAERVDCLITAGAQPPPPQSQPHGSPSLASAHAKG